MNTLNVVGRMLAAASLALAVTACGATTTPQAQAWTGTTEFGSTVHPLQVAAVVDGTDWTGSYTIGSTPPFTGDVVAELVDGALTGQLIATTNCRFELTGTITEGALEASFTPSACPGGEDGTWSATPAEAGE